MSSASAFSIEQFKICRFNSLPSDKILDWSKFKVFADNKIGVNEKLKCGLGRVENIVEKKRKCWLPAFSPFSTMFSKGLLLKIVESRNCVVKS